MSFTRRRLIKYLGFGMAVALVLGGGTVLYFRTMDLLKVSGMKDEIRHLLVTVQELYRDGHSQHRFDDLVSAGFVDSAVTRLVREHRLFYTPFGSSTPDTATVLSGEIHGIPLLYTKSDLVGQ